MPNVPTLRRPLVALAALAVLYSRKGELSLARDELVIALQTAPDYGVARENLGDVYAALAVLGLAPASRGQPAPMPTPAAATPPADAASGAAKAGPQEPFEISEAQRKAYAQGIAEARALLAQKKYDDAIAKLDQLARERPREPQARFLKAVALADHDKVDDAIAAYRGMTADFPEMPEPHNNLAVLYSRKGELSLARDELVIALQTAPDYGVARENLGDVYAALAAEQYDKAATLDKRNRSAPAKLKLVREVTAVAQ